MLDDVDGILGSAAFEGRIATLSTLLHARPHSVNMCDADRGRTALHWAVAGRRTSTVKYLIGRWSCDSLLGVQDAEGNTPLHLFCGPPAILLLLHSGGTCKPSLTVRNASGLSPVEAIALTHDYTAIEAQALLERALAAPPLTAQKQTALFSFLRLSPMRKPPARARPGLWTRQVTVRGLAISLLPNLLLIALFVIPWQSARWLGLFLVCAASAAAFRFGGCTRFGKELRAVLSVEPRLATQVLFALVLLLGLQNGLYFRTELAASPALACAHALCQAVTVATYVLVTTTDPGFVPGASDVDHEGYWRKMENMDRVDEEDEEERSGEEGDTESIVAVQGDKVMEAGAEEAGAGSPTRAHAALRSSRFCPRSELRRTPRARFSPYCKGTVQVMDHDCAFLGVCIGAGNHRSFLLFLLSAFASIFTGVGFAVDIFTCRHLHSLAICQQYAMASGHLARQPSLQDWRLFRLGVSLGGLILLPLGVLIQQQLRCIVSNVTVVEEMRWLKRNPRESALPVRGEPMWALYSPFDTGSSFANLAAFLRGERRGGQVERHRARQALQRKRQE